MVAEARGHGVRRDGRVYENSYVFIYVVEDGLIRRQREYNDLFRADEFLCGPLGPDVAVGEGGRG